MSYLRLAASWTCLNGWEGIVLVLVLVFHHTSGVSFIGDQGVLSLQILSCEAENFKLYAPGAGLLLGPTGGQF